MEEYIDQFLASSQWTEMSSTGSSPWTSTPANQTGGLLLDPISLLTEDENKNSTTSLFQANHIGESFCNQVLTRQDAAHVDQLVSCNPNYNQDNEFISADSQNESLKKCLLLQQQGLLSNASIGSMGVHLNNITEVPYSKLSHFPPGVSTKSAGPLTDAGSIGTNGNEFPGFGRTLGDVNSSFTTSLLDPHTTESMIGSLLRKGKLNGLEGDLSGLNGELLQKGSGNNDQQFLMENISVLGNVPDNGQFCNFSVPPDMDFSQTPGWQTKLAYGNHTCVGQLQPNSDTGGGSNGAAKQHVRARRGQATDPHSIAERLRREKIAERMKNLQELVPNSNRTDKASMLDEIIEYVKFLQLQVKVLSMSRMGATGAVVRLITETQSESCDSLHLSASASASPGNTSSLSDSQDAVACEQEVVKLMESNVTSAMQFLQTKGLCLMPIALACAISGRKRSASEPIVEAINENIIENGSSAPATNIMPCSSGSDSTIDNLTNSKKDDATNDGWEKAPSVEPEHPKPKI